MRFRLARHSPYRFAPAIDPEGREWIWAPGGAGSLLRMFEAIDQGQMSVSVPVTDASGTRSALRVTARVTHPDGRPLTIPDLSEIAPRMLPVTDSGDSPLTLKRSPNGGRPVPGAARNDNR